MHRNIISWCILLSVLVKAAAATTTDKNSSHITGYGFTVGIKTFTDTNWPFLVQAIAAHEANIVDILARDYEDEMPGATTVYFAKSKTQSVFGEQHHIHLPLYSSDSPLAQERFGAKFTLNLLVRCAAISHDSNIPAIELYSSIDFRFLLRPETFRHFITFDRPRILSIKKGSIRAQYNFEVNSASIRDRIRDGVLPTDFEFGISFRYPNIRHSYAFLRSVTVESV